VRRFDVCNGDADGLCALVQWRLESPAEAVLVTGLKREIALLERVPAEAGDEVLVCDISLQRNLPALQRLLAAGARVRYFDHHVADAVPEHPGLQALIDTRPTVCTSLLVDRALQGRQRAWALVGAYGDNLASVADALAEAAGFSAAQRGQLRALGEAINYNAYGEQPEDVHVAPAELYRILLRYRDPLQLIAQEPIAAELQALREADLRRARAVAPHWQGEGGTVLLLPDAPWSRRAAGSFANELAGREPGRAHAVLVADARGGYRASIRAPLQSPAGAHGLCACFGGAGRAGAAGIDHLPAGELPAFVQAFSACRWGR
jgi:hypothetical protein